MENVSISIPKEVTEELTYKTSVENNMLNIDYYYGEQLLGSSSMQASDEILKTSQELSPEKTEETDASVSPKPNKDTSEKKHHPSFMEVILHYFYLSPESYSILFFLS